MVWPYKGIEGRDRPGYQVTDTGRELALVSYNVKIRRERTLLSCVL